MADQQNPGQTPPNNPYDPASQGQPHVPGAGPLPPEAGGHPSVSGAVNAAGGFVSAAETVKGFGNWLKNKATQVKGLLSSEEQSRSTTEQTAAPANPPAETANPSASATGTPPNAATPSAPATGTPPNAASTSPKHWKQEEIPGVTEGIVTTKHPAADSTSSGLRNIPQRVTELLNKGMFGKDGVTTANLLGAGGGVAVMANARKRESTFGKVTQTLAGAFVTGVSLAAVFQGQSNQIAAGKKWVSHVSSNGNSQGRGAGPTP